MTTPPLKPTRTLAEVAARVLADLEKRTPALPKPLTDEKPPQHWQETDTQQDEEDAR